MLSVKLVVVGGDAKRKEVALKLPTVIGRGKDGVTLNLPHKLVSRKHTELFENDGELYVRDLGSLNGTFVNNKRIAEAQPLLPNQLLTLGNVTFRAIYDCSAFRKSDDRDRDQDTADTSHVLDDTSSDSNEDSDTGKSLLDAAVELANESENEAASHIFSGHEIAGLSPEKSISASAIDHLPAVKNAAFDVQLDGATCPESIKKVEIELDESVPELRDNDSRLGSFLKKMPR